MFAFLPAALLAAVPATSIPSSTDAGRIAPQAKPLSPTLDLPAFEAPKAPHVQAPEGSKSIHFVLRRIKINGMNASGGAVFA